MADWKGEDGLPGSPPKAGAGSGTGRAAKGEAALASAMAACPKGEAPGISGKEKGEVPDDETNGDVGGPKEGLEKGDVGSCGGRVAPGPPNGDLPESPASSGSVTGPALPPSSEVMPGPPPGKGGGPPGKPPPGVAEAKGLAFDSGPPAAAKGEAEGGTVMPKGEGEGA